MSTLMPYVLLVSCVVVAAALLAERALGALGRPTRGVWLAALAASIAMPILASAVDGAQGGPSAAGVFAGPGGDTLGEVAAATLEKPVPSAVEPGFVWQEWTEWAPGPVGSRSSMPRRGPRRRRSTTRFSPCGPRRRR